MKRYLLVILTSILVSFAEAQDSGVLLIICNTNSTLTIDGESKGNLEANKPFKLNATVGEHYIQAQSSNGAAEQIVTIEPSKQKVVKLDISNASQTSPQKSINNNSLTPILVAELAFNIPGAIEIGAWESEHSEPYPDAPNYYYAFEKGDEVVLNFKMDNNKGTNIIKVTTYPDVSEIYSNNAFQELRDVRFKVNKRTILRFSLATNHILARVSHLNIQRIPSTAVSIDFNPAVTKKKIYETITIQPKSIQFVNSTSNATFKGGKSKIALPIFLPKNTVRWYFSFSSYRQSGEVDKVQQGFELATKLTKLIDETGGLGFAISRLTAPPGADYCDAYLLDKPNHDLFISGQQFRYLTLGTRENIKSGLVQMDASNTDTYYLGINNPDMTYGINVAVEVVAITSKIGWVMEHKD